MWGWIMLLWGGVCCWMGLCIFWIGRKVIGGIKIGGLMGCVRGYYLIKSEVVSF